MKKTLLMPHKHAQFQAFCGMRPSKKHKIDTVRPTFNAVAPFFQETLVFLEKINLREDCFEAIRNGYYYCVSYSLVIIVTL